MRALIDGDILRYRIGFACQTTFYDVWESWDGEQVHSRAFTKKKDLTEYLKTLEDGEYEVEERIEAEPIQNCLHSVKLQLNSILKGAKAQEYRILLTGENNFRDDLVDYYKANRDRDKRPVHYEAITQYLIDVWDARMVHGREADDALSILQLSGPNSEGTIICSIDKDLDMVPGWHYNFVKDETYYVREIDGLQFFYMQMLTGDDSDNIPGLSKITGTRRKRGEWAVHEKNIQELDQEEDMWNYVLMTYATVFAGLNSPDVNNTIDFHPIVTAVREKLREIGKLLWMQRTRDDDWEPPV